MLPVARQADLHVEQVGDDLVVYDHRTQAAHALNAAAACVWEQCDGARSAAEIAAELSLKEAAVADALSLLQAKDLLASAGTVTQPQARRITRRVLTKAAAAALVPAIVSIATPASALVLSNPNGPPGDGPGGIL